MTLAQAIYAAFQRHYRRWANRTVLQAAIARLHEVEPQNTKAGALAEHTLERMASVCEGMETPRIRSYERGTQIVLRFWTHTKRFEITANESGRLCVYQEWKPRGHEDEPDYPIGRVDVPIETDEQLAGLWQWYKE